MAVLKPHVPQRVAGVGWYIGLAGDDLAVAERPIGTGQARIGGPHRPAERHQHQHQTEGECRRASQQVVAPEQVADPAPHRC